MGPIPYGISNFVFLRELRINSFQGISNIEEISRLVGLVDLNLASNKLTQLPESFEKLINLKRLDIQYNQFLNLPSCLNNIERIRIEHEFKGLYTDISYQSLHPVENNFKKFHIGTTEELKSKLTNLLLKHNLIGAQEIIVSEALLAICFELTEKDPSNVVGNTRFGGSPDVPLSFEHPKTEERFWTFVAQINLQELAPHQGFLPRTGMFSFFYEDINQDSEKIKVFYFRQEEVKKQFQYPTDAQFSEEGAGVSSAVGYLANYSQHISLPYDYNLSNQMMTLEGRKFARSISEEYSENYEKLCDELYPDKRTNSGKHFINSFVFSQNETPPTYAAEKSGGRAEEWINLLTLNFDKKLAFSSFGDCGTLSFLIHATDLKALDTSKVRAQILGSFFF